VLRAASAAKGGIGFAAGGVALPFPAVHEFRLGKTSSSLSGHQTQQPCSPDV